MKKRFTHLLPIALLLIITISLISINPKNAMVGQVTKVAEIEQEIDDAVVQPYLDLLDHPKIKPLVQLTSVEEKLFLQKAMQLETGKTASWDKFKTDLTLNYQNIRQIWIERIVLIFYHEIHNTFNWKIIDYTPEDRKALLQFCTFEDLEKHCSQGFKKQDNTYRFHFVKNDNPLEPWSLFQSILTTSNLNTKQINNHEEALALLTAWMNNNNWQHDDPGTLLTAIPYTMIAKTKKTTSHSNREFLQATLRSLNIPTKNFYSMDKNNAAHGGIIFPTMNKGLISTDDIAAFPNSFLPLEQSLLSEKTMKELQQASLEKLCETYARTRKEVYTTFIVQADSKLSEKYLCINNQQKGDLFFEKANMFYQECNNQQKKLFSQDEINHLKEKIVCA